MYRTLPLECLVLCTGEDMDDAVRESGNVQVKEGHQDVAPPSSAPGTSDTAASHWHGPIKPEDKEELRQVWQHLKETVEALPHVGCYSIASVACRRQASLVLLPSCGLVCSSRYCSMLLPCALKLWQQVSSAVLLSDSEVCAPNCCL